MNAPEGADPGRTSQASKDDPSNEERSAIERTTRSKARATPATPTRSVSTWPSLAVVAIAAFIMLAGVLAAGLSGGSSTAGRASSNRSSSGAGSRGAISGTQVLAGISSLGEPPPDILGSLSFPRGSRAVRFVNQDHGAGLFNRSAEIIMTATPAETTAFIHNALEASHWSFLAEVRVANIAATAPGEALQLSRASSARVGLHTNQLSASGHALSYTSDASKSAGTEIIAKRPSQDGYYWEVGIVIAKKMLNTGPNGSVDHTEVLISLFELHSGM